MTTRVVNIRQEQAAVYIGRGSKWGNPYAPDYMRGRCMPGTIYLPADEVLPAYEQHVRSSAELMASLQDLAGLSLGCFCKPRPCHGDVLVRLIDEFIVTTFDAISGDGRFDGRETDR